MAAPPSPRRILTAEILSVGSEIVVGDTRDTNAGELARSLTASGVTVSRVTAVPDHLDVVAASFAAALERADLVISTGGLGPTPDDLTREAIAQVVDETPTIDGGLESWLRGLWARREMPFPELNLKQAWLIPSAMAMPNPNGTAPGWFVTRPDGRIIVALPGPPREMRPMWHDHVLPALVRGGLGTDFVTRTYRLTGIGESQIAERIGDLLTATDPEVATYARAEAVDVRITAVGNDGTPDGAPADRVEAASRIVLERLGDHVWATGEATWSEAIGEALERLGWRLAVVEIGTGGQVVALLGDVDWLTFDETLQPGSPAATTPGRNALVTFAKQARELGGAEVGLAVQARARGADTAVSIAVVTPTGEHRERRVAFLGGRQGRMRAALTAASALHRELQRSSRST